MANERLRDAMRDAVSDAHEHAGALVATTLELLEASRRLRAQLADTMSQARAEREQRHVAPRDLPTRDDG
jgi:hypothetical protein